MPRQKHYYGLNHLHYITRSTYRRARLFDSERFKRRFVCTLDELRSELGFKIIGHVLMPEHFHILIWPTAEHNPSQILQKLEEKSGWLSLSSRICETMRTTGGAKECSAASSFLPRFIIMLSSGSGKEAGMT